MKIRKTILICLAATLLLLQGMTVFAAEAEPTDLYPILEYENPYAWDANPTYPTTDEGDVLLADKQYHNAANFYIYVDTSNTDLMHIKAYILNALLWRPLESETNRYQLQGRDNAPLVAQEYLGINLNPYNLKEVEALDEGTIYFIQFGIADGYYAPGGRAGVAASRMNAYLEVLQNDYTVAPSIPWEFSKDVPDPDWQWQKAEGNDLNFYCLYGQEDWIDSNLEIFQQWCTANKGTPETVETIATTPDETMMESTEEMLATEEPTVEKVPAEITVEETPVAEKSSNNTLNLVLIVLFILAMLVLVIVKRQKR